jgi:hypothetical protein
MLTAILWIAFRHPAMGKRWNDVRQSSLTSEERM